MKDYCVYFRRNGRLVEKKYPTLTVTLIYVLRYLGKIKDFRFVSRFCGNADLLSLELCDGRYASIYMPLGSENLVYKHMNCLEEIKK